MKKRFERSPLPIPLLNTLLLPPFLGAVQTLAADEEMGRHTITRMNTLYSSGVFRRVATLCQQIPERLKLVSGGGGGGGGSILYC